MPAIPRREKGDDPVQKPVRYYIQTLDERPTMRTVPVAHARNTVSLGGDGERIAPPPATAESRAQDTAVGRLRLALKRGWR
jgi:hypothetical protein